MESTSSEHTDLGDFNQEEDMFGEDTTTTSGSTDAGDDDDDDDEKDTNRFVIFLLTLAAMVPVVCMVLSATSEIIWNHVLDLQNPRAKYVNT